MLKEWQHPTQCLCCKDIIYSRYSGEFVWCKCKAIAVDQTPYYGRIIGNREDFTEVPKDVACEESQ